MSLRSDEECTADPSLNSTIEALASCKRRCVLYYFMEHDETTASVDDVCDFVCTTNPTANDRSAAMTDLYHRVLPKLDDVDMIDFDSRSETIRIRDFGHAESIVHEIKAVES